MSATAKEKAQVAAAAYTRGALAVYDALALGINGPFIWRCPNRCIVDLYNRHLSANHLEVGPGTGYFLDRARFPSDDVRLTLLDLNTECLARTARRLVRFRPVLHHADVIEPLDIETEPFDSVGLNYVLHCLPGSMADKGGVLENLRQTMNSGAVLFGATLLQGGVEHGWLARRMPAEFNRKGVFNNTQDDAEGLKRTLAGVFRESAVTLVGGVGMFWARA